MSDAIDPRIREFSKHTYLEGKRTERLRYLEPHKLEQATDELDRMAEQTDQLAVELSRSLLPVDAKSRIMRCLSEFDGGDPGPDYYVLEAEAIVAALSAKETTDAGTGGEYRLEE